MRDRASFCSNCFNGKHGKCCPECWICFPDKKLFHDLLDKAIPFVEEHRLEIIDSVIYDRECRAIRGLLIKFAMDNWRIVKAGGKQNLKAKSQEK